MKEVEEKESIDVSSNGINILSSDEDISIKKDKSLEEPLVINEKLVEPELTAEANSVKQEPIPLLESSELISPLKNCEPDLTIANSSSLSKDLIVESDPLETESEFIKSELDIIDDEEAAHIKTVDNEIITLKKVVLRQKKSNVEEDCEGSLPKKSRSPSRKSDKNSAILENVSNYNKEESSQFNESKSESDECIQSTVLSPERDLSELSGTKSPDDTSSKSKENSECETVTSSTSESFVGKVPKKRKRKKDTGWCKKKKRKNGSQIKEDLNVGGINANTSPSNNENGVKKKNIEVVDQTQKKIEFAVPSPSLADGSMKPAVPESTATSNEIPKPSYCLCRKKPQVFISGNNNTGDLYCQALDCIDSRIVGCCNPIPSQDVGLYRASERAAYLMMCEVHQQRLARHNCCPGCGLFCTQGKYLMCKNLHNFHKACCFENHEDVVICPHCGDDSPPRIVNISIQSPKDPVFLPIQKPLRDLKAAKMSITRDKIEMGEGEEGKIYFPAPLLTITEDEVPQTNGVNRDKLANLLNIACRSFSKVCCSNRYSYKSLFNACQNGDAERLLKIIASGFSPNYVFEEINKKTPLHVASASGQLSIVHILLQAKAQVNALDGEQNTPLTTAIFAKQNDVVKYLIKCGADLTLKCEDGMTPLHLAAKCGNLEACDLLLKASQLPPKYIDGLDDGGWTPLVWASEFNHLEVVKFLMSKGADPLIKDAEQNIALHWAAFGGSIDIVDLYLNCGSDINAANVHGDTPLHIAARQDKYNCVLLLLARGAKSNERNKNGELPRDCSESPASDIYKAITLNMEISALLTRFQERTCRIISNDISRGKERNQIQCVNSVDDEEEPKDYVYVSESCFTSKIVVDRTINSLQFCKCKDDCGTDQCNCSIISIKCWYDNDGRLKPEFNYADPPMIFECNQACHCNRITCKNRVVQNGISCRFQLFRTEGKGWGIKTLNLIPKGTYVCEYVGEIISDCEADHREDDSYLFDLDNRDGETYCIDARHYGNFARFINHMCVPNLMPVHVFVDHQDLRFPRIAFFANRDILPDEELGYNYGEKFWVIKWKSFTCTCGDERCMYSENTIQTTLENYRKKIEENP